MACYIKMFNASASIEVEEQVNIFLSTCNDKLIDVKTRTDEHGSMITLVLGTMNRFRAKKFEFIKVESEDFAVNQAIQDWRNNFGMYRNLDDVVMVNGDNGIYLKMIYTEKDQIRSNRFALNR